MKKRLLPLILALALCLGLAVPAMAAEVTVEEVTPCEFLSAGEFSEGLACVHAEDGWGFIDKTGKAVIPFAFAGARPFSDGLAVVRETADGKLGFIDKSGKVVIPCEYDNIGGFNREGFSEGLAAVQKNDKWGFINKDGELVIPYEFDGVGSFHDGLAQAAKNGKGGLIDTTGAVVVPFEYSSGAPLVEGLAQVEKNGKRGFVDKTGKLVVPCKYDETYDFSEGLALVVANNKGGYVDQTGKEVIPCKYDDSTSFSEGLAAVQVSGKWGFIDKDGKEVIPCQYENAGGYSEGLAAVVTDGKWGFIDKDGKEVIPCQYEGVGNFVEGYAAVLLDGKVGLIDKEGKEVVPCKYDSVTPLSDGMVCVGMVQPGSDPEDPVILAGYLAIKEAAPEPAAPAAKVDGWAKEQVDAAAAAGLIAEGLGEDYTKNITRAQFAAVAVKLYEAMSGQAAPEAGESPFPDTSDPVVIQANALGIVTGNEDKTFAPDAQVTREDAATMLSRVYTKLGGEIPQVEATSFADDSEMNGYARSAVAFMVDKKIINGVGDNKFDPQGKAAIQEALIIAARMLENLK